MLNPFNKPFDSRLDATDLQQLVTLGVAEGFHVEYKRELPSHQKIAKSVASFANTYGGWYIVGVRADAHNVAVDVPGFELATCPDPVSVLRDVAKTHIDPVPVFHAQVVGIGADRAVLVVHIGLIRRRAWALFPLLIGAGPTGLTACGDGSSSATGACCKVCRQGKACGDTCIEASKTCRVGRGCACNG